jgi:Na+/melibiose symporter-like transporter
MVESNTNKKDLLSNSNIIDNEPLPLISKISFSLAGIPFRMVFCAIGVFTNVFLLETAKLPPEKTLYVLFVSRIVDAITDPIYAYLVNKSPITRYGKMKPWYFFFSFLTLCKQLNTLLK